MQNQYDDQVNHDQGEYPEQRETVNPNDIHLGNLNDVSHIKAGQEELQFKPPTIAQARSGGMRGQKSPEGGKPTRISAYANANVDDTRRLSHMVPLKGLKCDGGHQDEPTGEEDSDGPAPKNKDANIERDIKQAVKNIDEMVQVVEVIKVIEKNYCGCKKKLPQYDIQGLESDVTVQTVNQCYNIIHDLMNEENPNFDKEKMDFKITDTITQVNQVTHDFNRIKGEFIAVHDSVINKDPLAFKLERIQRYQTKQDALIQKLPAIEEALQENQSNVKLIKKQYENFEKAIFEKKNVETKYVIKDTNELLEEIGQQQEKIAVLVEKAKKDMDEVTPNNSEQRQKLNKINDEIVDVEGRLNKSLKVIEREQQEKTTLDIKEKQCEDITEKLTSQNLISMLNQSRSLKQLVETHNDWIEMNKRLKSLQDEAINSAEFDLQKALQDTKKYLDAVNKDRKDEYDDIIKQIQKLAKKIGADAETQNIRLDDFNQNNLGQDGIIDSIPDPDFIFLKNEVARYGNNLDALKAQKDKILEDSMEIHNDNLKNINKNIEQAELDELKQNLKQLNKIDENDVPRVKKLIDQLEAFTVKALSNQLNDDNRKTQGEISQIKKNFEDLQKKIDACNNKLGKVADDAQKLKDNFQNDDLERDNDITKNVDKVLGECDRDTNGDKANKGLKPKPEENPDAVAVKPLTTQKKDIVGKINKLVNQFNENNKQVKEMNRAPKDEPVRTEKEMNDLITKNQEIMDECKVIDDKINEAKDLAKDIIDRLDVIAEPVIPEIKDKYIDKNQAIDECDELFDKANAQIDTLDADIDAKLDKIKDIQALLDTANPIIHPSTSGKDNSDLLKEVQEKNKENDELRDALQKLKDDIGKTKDNLVNVVQPLNELGEREVKKPEIDDILKKLDEINEKLLDDAKKLEPLGDQLDNLEKDVNDLLDSDKSRKVEEAEDKLAKLDDKLDDLKLEREDINAKLNELKDLIADAKNGQAKDDPDLAAKLKQYEAEVKGLEKDLKDIDNKIDDLKKKRGDAKKLIDDMKQNPNKFTPKQIDEVIQALDDQNDKAGVINDKLKDIEDDLDKKIDDLKNLMSSSQDRKQLQQQANDLQDQIDSDLKAFENILKNTPQEIEKMLVVEGEMKNGSEPDESADYWEERKDIDRQTADLKKLKAAFEKHEKNFQKKVGEVEAIKSNSKRNPDVEGLQKIVQDLKEIQRDLDDKLSEAIDSADQVDAIKKEMDDCQIPVNINMRQSEVNQFCDKLDKVKAEFAELKKADADFEGKSDSEKMIKDLIKQGEFTIKGLDQDKKDHTRFQEGTLNKIPPKDYINFDKSPQIIIIIREFKIRIISSGLKLKEAKDILDQLNTELLKQDIDNASNILGKKTKTLKDRLKVAKEELEKIEETGEKMEGNTSQNDEDEFIDALKDEMPEVFKNIDANFDQLEHMDDLLKDIEKTKDIEKMTELKKEADEATSKVEQSEGLVQKLENEIIEWNAHKKLVRRDEELEEIDNLLKDFDKEIQDEVNQMGKELAKNKNKIEKDGDSKGNLGKQQEAIVNFGGELEELQGQVVDLLKEREQCFNEFNPEVPAPILVDRAKRAQEGDQFTSPGNRKGKKPSAPINTVSDKPYNDYYMLDVNARYKRRIHALLMELRKINQRKKELEDKYAPLKKELSAVVQPKMYKAVKGDPIDELFAFHLNKAQLNLPVKRTGPGKYVFGTRNILAKIINGKLVIRVGGGYMSADEFIEQYGRMELMKMMKAQEMEMGSDDGSKGGRMMGGRGSGRGSNGGMDPKVMSMADMKDVLRGSLNVKTYENDKTSSNLGQSMKTTTAKNGKSLASLDAKYDSVKFGKGAQSPPPQRSKMGSPDQRSPIGRGNKYGSPKRS